MSTNLPSFIAGTIATAAATGGTFVFDMRGIDRASLQIDSTFSNAGDTDVITLKLSNDNTNFVAFATNKTVTLTGGTTDHALFELGSIDFAYLQVSYATPSAHTVSLKGTLYAVATLVNNVS
jgi:hypothetical protein